MVRRSITPATFHSRTGRGHLPPWLMPQRDQIIGGGWVHLKGAMLADMGRNRMAFPDWGSLAAWSPREEAPLAVGDSISTMGP